MKFTRLRILRILSIAALGCFVLERASHPEFMHANRPSLVFLGQAFLFVFGLACVAQGLLLLRIYDQPNLR